MCLPFSSINHVSNMTHENSADMPGLHPGHDQRSVLSVADKGIPQAMSASELSRQGWNVLAGDLPFPIAVLKQSALDHNSRWMRSFIAAAGVSLAPHGKTTMSPQLFQRQIADGCWGITVATAQQAAVAAQHGIKRILIANQLVGRANIAIILDLLRRDPSLDLYCYVDSRAGGSMLHEAMVAVDTPPLNVLLEIGFKGGRTGCRDQAAVESVLDALAATGGKLKLRGIAGYEGLITAETPEATERAVAAFLDLLADTLDRCQRRSAFKPAADGNGEIIVTAGGSTFFDLVAQRLSPLVARGGVRIVIRSGCYLTHDHGIYADDFPRLQGRIGPDLAQRLGRLEPALYLWSIVQSQPEPGLALLTLGKRDAGHDAGLPRPVLKRSVLTGDISELTADWRIDKMNDQHAYLCLPDGASVEVGDLICLGISHPCTTFDKWREILVVDDDWTVIDAIHTFF
jgi:D-serine dehydratase